MIAAYLRRAKIAPDLVICSTAMRAQQTLDPIAKAKKPPKVVLEREVYGGAQRALWERCKFASNIDPLRGLFASNSDPF
jgi:phosphohistidine phosphatase SixA